MRGYLLEANIQFALLCESISAEKGCHLVSSLSECSNRYRWDLEKKSTFSNAEDVLSEAFIWGTDI